MQAGHRLRQEQALVSVPSHELLGHATSLITHRAKQLHSPRTQCKEGLMVIYARRVVMIITEVWSLLCFAA
jgi:hypothetical protein